MANIKLRFALPRLQLAMTIGTSIWEMIVIVLSSIVILIVIILSSIVILSLILQTYRDWSGTLQPVSQLSLKPGEEEIKKKGWWHFW